MIKHSQFNHLAQLPEERSWALVNFAYCTATRLDAAQKAVFDSAPNLHSDAPLVQSWLRQGFLVDAGVDEAKELRERVDDAREAFVHGDRRLSLEVVVRVTSACNFACPYCFQYRRGGHMSSEVRDALVEFTERRLASGRYDHLGIEWFGGEPLLAPDLIDELSARFMAPCQAALPNEVHIDELGNTYPHCSFYSVDPSDSVGNLLDEDGGGPDAWLDALESRAQELCFPSDQPKCLKCKYLPCCLGGCPVQRIEKGEPECPSALFDPDAYAIERLRAIDKTAAVAKHAPKLA